MVYELLAICLLSGDNPARATFAKFEKFLIARRSVSGDLVGQGVGTGVIRSAFLLAQPKSFRVTDGRINIYCNGKVQYNHLVREREWFKRDVSKGLGVGFPYGLDGVFGLPTGSTAPYFVKKTEYRMQKVDGRMCAAKAIHFESFGRDDRMVFYIDPEPLQLVGFDQVFGDTKMQFRFANLQYDVPVSQDAFDWSPSPDLKERVNNNPAHS